MKLHEHNVLDDLAERPSVSAGNYVDLCLELVNWREGDDPNRLVTIPAVLMTNTEELRDAFNASGHRFDVPGDNDGVDDPPKVMREGGLKLRDRLRRTLNDFVERSPGNLALWRAKADSACQSVKVMTKLNVLDSGVLDHGHRYIPVDHDAVEGLLLAFMMDPTKPAGGEVRVCALKTCGRYFVAKKNAKGGPRRRYCADEHRIEADRNAAIVRMSARRAAEKRKRGAKRRPRFERQ